MSFDPIDAENRSRPTNTEGLNDPSEDGLSRSVNISEVDEAKVDETEKKEEPISKETSHTEEEPKIDDKVLTAEKKKDEQKSNSNDEKENDMPLEKDCPKNAKRSR